MSESSPGKAAANEQAAGAQSAPDRNGPVDASSPASNGAVAPAATPTAGPTANSAVQRAEVLADRLGARVASFTTTIGRSLFRFGARVREEAEDIWAEAQNIRRGDKDKS
jgi:hypothetical protein